jgi:hypothetical protein
MLPERARTRGRQTLCHHCLGAGQVAVERAVASPRAGTPWAGGHQLRDCRYCLGDRWLPGIVPPV